MKKEEERIRQITSDLIDWVSENTEDYEEGMDVVVYALETFILCSAKNGGQALVDEVEVKMNDIIDKARNTKEEPVDMDDLLS